jgi:hypothetical protein
MAEVYSIIEGVLSPSSLGFEQVRERVWVRRVDGEHTSMWSLQPVKGAAMTIVWGTSVPYVPVRLVPRLRWAQTLKQSTAALWETSGEVWSRSGGLLMRGGIDTPTGRGRQCVEDDAQELWTAVRDRAVAFWNTTSSPAGLLAAAQQQAAHPSIHDPAPALTAVFTRIRLGDTTAARTRLSQLTSTLTKEELEAAKRAIDLLHHPSPDRA